MLNVFRPLLLTAAILVAGPVFAQDPPVEPRVEPQAEPRVDPRSQREAAGNRIRQVEREGGRVLRAEPMQRGGRETYRIKVLTPEGRVRVLDEGRTARPERDDRRRSRAESRRAAPPPEAEQPPRRGDDGRTRGDRRN